MKEFKIAPRGGNFSTTIKLRLSQQGRKAGLIWVRGGVPPPRSFFGLSPSESLLASCFVKHYQIGFIYSGSFHILSFATASITFRITARYNYVSHTGFVRPYLQPLYRYLAVSSVYSNLHYRIHSSTYATVGLSSVASLATITLLWHAAFS